MRYSMDGADARTAGALMPIMPVTPRASTYTQVVITGQPGTQGIYAPHPEAIPPNSMVASTQPSHLAPDWIFPSLYWPGADNMHSPMSYYRDNEMPAPAIGSYRVPRVRMTGKRIGGSTQVMWPATVQRWPNRAGGGSG